MKIDIQQLVRNYRACNGITQKQLAKHLGISYRTIEKWEQGCCEPKGLSRIALISQLQKSYPQEAYS